MTIFKRKTQIEFDYKVQIVLNILKNDYNYILIDRLTEYGKKIVIETLKVLEKYPNYEVFEIKRILERDYNAFDLYQAKVIIKNVLKIYKSIS